MAAVEKPQAGEAETEARPRYADVRVGSDAAAAHLVRFLEERAIEAVKRLDAAVVRVELGADHFRVPVANLALVVALEAWLDEVGAESVEVELDGGSWTVLPRLEEVDDVPEGETAILSRPTIAG